MPFHPTPGSSHRKMFFVVISAPSPVSSPSYTSLWHFLISSQVTMDIIYLRTPLAFLLLPLVVFGAPTDEPNLTEPAPGACKRCCDPLDSSTDAPPIPPSHYHLPYPMPEVRPYINITILKGKCLSWPRDAKACSGTGGTVVEVRAGLLACWLC